jgi:hypothetical protein
MLPLHLCLHRLIDLSPKLTISRRLTAAANEKSDRLDEEPNAKTGKFVLHGSRLSRSLRGNASLTRQDLQRAK